MAHSKGVSQRMCARKGVANALKDELRGVVQVEKKCKVDVDENISR